MKKYTVIIMPARASNTSVALGDSNASAVLHYSYWNWLAILRIESMLIIIFIISADGSNLVQNGHVYISIKRIFVFTLNPLTFRNGLFLTRTNSNRNLYIRFIQELCNYILYKMSWYVPDHHLLEGRVTILFLRYNCSDWFTTLLQLNCLE